MAGDQGGPPPANVAVFVSLAPALLAGVVSLRAWALWLMLPTRSSETIAVTGAALLEDAIVFGRSLPVLFLLSWPLLRLRSLRRRIGALALLWSLWLLLQIGLEQYFLGAGVPLGADFMATFAGGLRMDAAALAGWWLPLGVLCTGLLLCARNPALPRAPLAVIVLVACAGLWLVPLRTVARAEAVDRNDLAINKVALFARANLDQWPARSGVTTRGSASETAIAPRPAMLHAHDVLAPEGADADTVEIGVRFTNASPAATGAFVPLLVLMGEDGHELRESYAAPLQLRSGESGHARFSVKLDGLASGHYFIAVLPSHPETGQRVGRGIYRVPFKVRCCSPGGGARARP